MCSRILYPIVFVVVLSPICLQSADSTSKCSTCNNITNRFAEGLVITAKSNFGGGNTHWEEKKLGNFAYSETRLLEILDHVCSDSAKNEQCHLMVEENEEIIEKWWFTVYAKGFDINLNSYLCIESLKVCCRNGTYGADCVECPGGAARPCSGNGRCLGAGMRDGSGRCSCDTGYQGDLCSDCSERYFVESRNETHAVCRECHRACTATCRGEGAADCDSCTSGWILEEDGNMCVDVNECESETSPPCAAGEYCQNNEGSYLCISCHPACNGCTDSGSDQCLECSSKYWRDTTSCEPCHPSCMTSCTDGTPLTCDDCAVGWQQTDNGCNDIDECSSASVCSNNTYCLNTEGSYMCSECHSVCLSCDGPSSKNCFDCQPGYTKDTDNDCIDVDECVADVSVCPGVNEKCVNTLGGYKCGCQDGFKRVQRQCQPKRSKNTKSKKKTKPGAGEKSLQELDPVIEAASKILGEPIGDALGQPVDIAPDQDDMIVMEGHLNIPTETENERRPHDDL